MSNTTISPNMNLPIPTVGVDPGPDWATDNNACLNAIDSHNHSAGQGVQITPSGMDINADLSMGNNNLTTVRTVNFTSQNSPLALAADIGCIYVSGKDLYYNDEDGNQVRITSSGSVNAGAGSITGLPSGTAGVTFSGGTYTFTSATNTRATIAVGPVAIAAATTTASPKNVTISASGSQPASYPLVLPLAQGTSNTVLSNDGSGNLTFSPITTILATQGIGQVVSAHASGATANHSWTALTNITLTTGTWIITGGLYYSGIAGSTYVAININTISGSDTGTTNGTNNFINAASVALSLGSAVIPGYTAIVSGSTIFYLNMQLSASDANSVSGTITAVRVA